MNEAGISNDDILPITYINSSASVKARVGEMGGMVCTSSNAYKIIEKGLKSGKKIFFVPDRCLGQNFAKSLGLKSAVIGDGTNLKEADIICYNGFCSVHQQFNIDDIDFYREKYPGIIVAVHPECDPSVCDKADFVGSTIDLDDLTINKILNDNELIDKVIVSMNSIEELTDALDITFSPELTTDDVQDVEDDEEENEPEEDSDDTDFSSNAIFIPTDIDNGDDE
jgi:quinolinate synthase